MPLFKRSHKDKKGKASAHPVQEQPQPQQPNGTATKQPQQSTRPKSSSSRLTRTLTRTLSTSSSTSSASSWSCHGRDAPQDWNPHATSPSSSSSAFPPVPLPTAPTEAGDEIEQISSARGLGIRDLDLGPTRRWRGDEVSHGSLDASQLSASPSFDGPPLSPWSSTSSRELSTPLDSSSGHTDARLFVKSGPFAPSATPSPVGPPSPAGSIGSCFYAPSFLALASPPHLSSRDSMSFAGAHPFARDPDPFAASFRPQSFTVSAAAAAANHQHLQPVSSPLTQLAKQPCLPRVTSPPPHPSPREPLPPLPRSPRTTSRTSSFTSIASSSAGLSPTLAFSPVRPLVVRSRAASNASSVLATSTSSSPSSSRPQSPNVATGASCRPLFAAPTRPPPPIPTSPPSYPRIASFASSSSSMQSRSRSTSVGSSSLRPASNASSGLPQSAALNTWDDLDLVLLELEGSREEEAAPARHSRDKPLPATPVEDEPEGQRRTSWRKEGSVEALEEEEVKEDQGVFGVLVRDESEPSCLAYLEDSDADSDADADERDDVPQAMLHVFSVALPSSGSSASLAMSHSPSLQSVLDVAAFDFPAPPAHHPSMTAGARSSTSFSRPGSAASFSSTLSKAHHRLPPTCHAHAQSHAQSSSISSLCSSLSSTSSSYRFMPDTPSSPIHSMHVQQQRAASSDGGSHEDLDPQAEDDDDADRTTSTVRWAPPAQWYKAASASPSSPGADGQAVAWGTAF